MTCAYREKTGNINEGWTIAKRLLQHDRSMISGMGLGGGSRNSENSMENQAKRYVASQTARSPTLNCDTALLASK